MNDSRVDELIGVYRDGLLHDTLPFWIRHAVDHEHGGFMTCVDQDGKVVDTDKGVWQQGRITWLLARLYNDVERNEEWLSLALSGASFMEKHCFDPTDGRMWFHVTQDGRPVRKRRYAFSESFAAIAFGELARATGNARFAELAENTFQSFIQHNLSPLGVQPKYTDERPMRGLGFPMITIATAQELRRSIDLKGADDFIERGIQDIRQLHIKEDIGCVMETVAPDGRIIDHFDGRTLNPGHAIEAAWFFMREGSHRGDRQLIQLGCRMLEWMWHRGWDQDHGGILYFTDVNGGPVQEYWHDMKFWWPQTEAVIATLMAWVLTDDPRYAELHSLVHDYCYRHFPDMRHGEWFGYLHRDGSLSSTLKGNLWKGPFHLGRMQLTCWQLLAARKDETGDLGRLSGPQWPT